jgi:hypothetical protein
LIEETLDRTLWELALKEAMDYEMDNLCLQALKFEVFSLLLISAINFVGSRNTR